MDKYTNLLIIGAGPFGLSLSAYANRLGIEHMVVGKHMEFWKNNMPTGMLLRSTCDWHLDVNDEATINQFLASQSSGCREVEPLSLEFYLSYTAWFIRQKQLDILPVYIKQLDHASNGYKAIASDGSIIFAKQVVVATGIKYFKYSPADIINILPEGSYAHTCDMVEMASMKNKRIFIQGGRQSAFEWAALLQEAGAKEVHICHRHKSPAFSSADWSWVGPLFENTDKDPAWFRKLPQQEKEDIVKRLWAEGRLKVEPWLRERVSKKNVHIWQETQVVSCKKLPDNELEILLDNGHAVTADHIILATGYKIDMTRIPFISAGNILKKLAIENNSPVLDETFQTNLPGLYITGMAASQYFGPFFGFTIAVRRSAKIIGNAVAKRIECLNSAMGH